MTDRANARHLLLGYISINNTEGIDVLVQIYI